MSDLAPAAARSRFAALGRWPARSVLLLLLALILAGFVAQPAPVPAASGSSGDKADVALYDRVVDGVRSGKDYYEVAAEAHREGGYPLRPFVTVRLPTLALTQALLPAGSSALLLYLLLLATLAVWAKRLTASGEAPRRAVIGALLILIGCATLLLPDLLGWHETWAALLIALSLGLRSARSFLPSVLAGLLAMLVREQALLFALVMAGAALREKRGSECAAWVAAIILFGCFLFWHAARVAGVTTPEDLGSPGWTGGGGWGAAVTMAQLTGPLRLVPHWAAAIMIPLALLGWAGWNSAAGLRGTLFVALLLMVLATMARPDNFYWGFLLAPLLPLGLLFLPASLRDLAARAFPPARTPAPEAPLST